MQEGGSRMVFCTKCGAEIAPGIKLCPVCGAAPRGREIGQEVKRLRKRIFRTRENNRTVDPEEAESGKYWAAASYLPLFAPVAWLWKKKNSFVRFHAHEGLRLLAAEAAVLGAAILFGILFSLTWKAAVFWSDLFFGLIGVGFLFLIALGVRHALMGRQKELPFFHPPRT